MRIMLERVFFFFVRCSLGTADSPTPFHSCPVRKRKRKGSHCPHEFKNKQCWWWISIESCRSHTAKTVCGSCHRRVRPTVSPPTSLSFSLSFSLDFLFLRASALCKPFLYDDTRLGGCLDSLEIQLRPMPRMGLPLLSFCDVSVQETGLCSTTTTPSLSLSHSH